MLFIQLLTTGAQQIDYYLLVKIEYDSRETA